MTEGPKPDAFHCPQCGAQVASPRPAACPSCGNVLKGPVSDIVFTGDDPYGPPPMLPEANHPGLATNPYEAPKGLDEGRSPFTTASIALWVGVLAVLVVTAFTDLYSAGALAVVTVPALIRTMIGTWRMPEPPAFVWQLGLFVRSFGLSVLTLTAAGIAFVATCVPAAVVLGFQLVSNDPASGPTGLYIAVGAGLLTAGFSIWFLARKLWPLRK
jgi:hypothetical protein